MINYVYVWFANFRLRFLGCLDWNICFTQIFFSILISVWSFQCTIWLNVYQSSEASILWILWSLVKPVILFWSGSHLLSHTVTSIVSSAAFVLTIVFGMWTGVSQKRIATRSILSYIARSNPLDSAPLHLAVRLRRISASKLKAL